MFPICAESAYSDGLDEDEGLSAIDGSIEEEEDDLEEEEGLTGAQGSVSGTIEDETEPKGYTSAARASGREVSSSVVSEEQQYSDSFGSAPQSASVEVARGGKASIGRGSALSGMTDIEAEHARRISQLRREVEE